MRTINKINLYYCLFLITLACIVYLPSINHDFIPLYDDTPYIICNPNIQGFSIDNIKAAFSRSYCGNYAPLHIISYMLNYSLSGLQPSGFILTNIIIHILNGILLFYLFVRSGFKPQYAWAAATIFMLHPVQVESVVWASERKTVLSMLFFLMAIHFYINYLHGSGRKHYLISLMSLCAALLSKPVAVILPGVLMVYDIAYRKHDSRMQFITDKIPFALIAGIATGIALYTQAPELNGGRTSYHGGSPLATFFTMLPVLSKYVVMVFYPVGLSPYYGNLAVKTAFDEDVFLAGLIVISLIVLGVWLLRNNKELFCWYAIFFIGLLPVSQIIPIVTLINDRYLYFPLVGGVGFCVGVVRYGVDRYLQKRVPVFIAGILLCFTLALLTYQQTKTWQNTFTLYRQIIAQNTENIDLKILEDQNFFNSNVNGLKEVAKTLLQNFPSSPEVLKFAGNIYLKANDQKNAKECLEKAVSLKPTDTESLLNLAAIYRQSDDIENARRAYRLILKLHPESNAAKQGLTETGD